jgi:hypothetical protein
MGGLYNYVKYPFADFILLLTLMGIFAAMLATINTLEFFFVVHALDLQVIFLFQN